MAPSPWRQNALLNIDSIADQPELELLETALPACFERLDPLAIFGRIGYVHDDPNKIVPIENATMPPVAMEKFIHFCGGTEPVQPKLHGGNGSNRHMWDFDSDMPPRT